MKVTANRVTWAVERWVQAEVENEQEAAEVGIKKKVRQKMQTWGNSCSPNHFLPNKLLHLQSPSPVMLTRLGVFFCCQQSSSLTWDCLINGLAINLPLQSFNFAKMVPQHFFFLLVKLLYFLNFVNLVYIYNLQ